MTAADRDMRGTMSLRAWLSTQDRLKNAAAADDENRGFTTLAGDLLEAPLDFTRCHRCNKPVQVQYGNLAGKPFREWADEARWTVSRQHPDHQLVLIGFESASETSAAGGV